MSLFEDVILAMTQHEVAIVEAGEARRLFEATNGPTDPEAKRLIRVCNRLEDVIRRTRVNKLKAMKALVDATGGLPTP